MKGRVFVDEKDRVVVETARGWIDWPVQYANRRIAYDAPERVSLALKRKVAQAFAQLRARQGKR